MTTHDTSSAGPPDGTGTEPAQARYEAGAGADPDVIVLDEHDIVEAHGDPGQPASATAGEEPSVPAALSADWHDIQAMFVDDPQGSVARAAEAAEAAAAALVDTLQQRQAALAPDASGADTEQLRAALRSYRTFCQSMADIGEHITAG